MVGEVFIFWSKSHVSIFGICLYIYLISFFFFGSLSLLSFCLFLLQNFKREEQNFVVMNEINNMSFLTADSKSKMSKVRVEK